ncbi:GNAT family N-acetyltransferase [Streptomyces sp. 4N509B]|uniref:GNAT family N-acetyltransferase n=1 Tax=Streptomyces sp. 4N509B TaxID=3457413 RepID=UPI003FD6B6F2
MDFVAGGRLEVRITPSDVGRRVSVRTVAAPGDWPARFTDTLGVLSSWENGVLRVTRRDGRVARLAESDLVAAKVVPPTPARARGVPAADVRELTWVAARGWPAPERERIGGWSAGAGGGWTRRANSAYRTGAHAAPERPEADPSELDRVVAWYAARGLPARLHVVTPAAGAERAPDPDAEAAASLDAALAAAGWRAVAETACLVAPLAPLADLAPDDVPSNGRPPRERIEVGRELTEAWLRGYPRAEQDPGTARRVLTGGPSVWFATAAAQPAAADDGAGDGEETAAVGRCVVDGRWAGFAAIQVAPAHRRRGLATAVMAALAQAALAEGASAAYLQVETDNEPALTLYRRLGFTEHHRYHYRELP